METTHEMLRTVRKELSQSKTIMRMASSLNYASLEERVRIYEELFFGLQNPRMTTRNTTMNC